MRRLLLVLTALGLLGLIVYRQRTLDRWEQTLGIAGNGGRSTLGGTARR